MRLDKFLSEQLNITRSRARELVRKRLVAVDGVTAVDCGAQVDPERDTVIAEGKTVRYREHLYIMLNKPAGVVCATRDGLSRTVLELLPEKLRRRGLFPAGRLDKDTEGFVLITDDGGFAHRILSPKSHVDKRYFAVLERPAPPEYAEKFLEGITIDGDERCLPAVLELTEIPTEVYVTLREGKYHQVKRMFEALGNRVAYLKRVSIGGLALDGSLAAGECREISSEELLLIGNRR